MCETRTELSVSDALGMLDRALDALNAADAGTLPAAAQAQVLRELQRAEAKQTAARAAVLTAFAGQRAFEEDGQGSARTWLKWHTRITHRAAAEAVGWARRLPAHPAVGQALARGEISASWAKEICDWSEGLPQARRADADAILLQAAAGGARFADLAALAREMLERSRLGEPGSGTDERFDERYFHLGITFRGAGRAEGDLTPPCAAALSAVLDALSKKRGAQDRRTAAQRRHDALEEACRRLIAAGLLPGRAGQHTQIHVHMTLAQLRSMPGAAEIEAAWIGSTADRPGTLTGADGDATTCDASVVPVVTGLVDWAALDKLTATFLISHGRNPDGSASCGCVCGRCRCPGRAPLPPQTRDRLRRALLSLAVDTLSGPGGLAAALRAGLAGDPLRTPSLPLDIGAAGETVPVHLRRAAIVRHPTCAFPGCDRPATACDIHHLIPRSRGGPTALHNLVPVCEFHHLIVIHRWGWSLRLNADGTTTAISPGGAAYDSHSPPPARAP